MPRGRPRTPTDVLDAKGAFKKDPQRKAARQNEPKPNGPVGEPPSYFDDFHRGIWGELIDECPERVLTKADRKHLELATRLTAKMRIVPGRMHRWLKFLGEALLMLGMNPIDVEAMKEDFRAALGCSSQELSLLATTLTRMGMTPADRSRVQAEPENPDDDPFEQLAAALRGGDTGKSVQ